MTPDISLLLIPALNHLLAGEPWAMQQLRAHAGKVICVDLDRIAVRCALTGQGLLDASAAAADTANVTIRIRLADLPRIMQDRQRAISYVRLEGDADLAETVAALAKNLRWDSEQQLSAIFGDLLGQRLARTGGRAFSQLQVTAQKFQENLAEYFLEENPMLIRPEQVAGFSDQLGRTRDDVERLMKRIEKLEQAHK